MLPRVSRDTVPRWRSSRVSSSASTAPTGVSKRSARRSPLHRPTRAWKPSRRFTRARRRAPASTRRTGWTCSARKRQRRATRPRPSWAIVPAPPRESSEERRFTCCGRRATRRTRRCSRSARGTAAAFSASCSGRPRANCSTTAPARCSSPARSRRAHGSRDASCSASTARAPALAALATADELASRIGATVEVVSATSGGSRPEGAWTGRVDSWDDAHPVAALVRRSRAADLVVVGSRGLHGLRALGSVSERVAHRAHCSVLVVHDG